MPTHPKEPRWYSQGFVYDLKPSGLLVQLKRIEGPSFDSKEEAERHGSEIARRWVEERNE